MLVDKRKFSSKSFFKNFFRNLDLQNSTEVGRKHYFEGIMVGKKKCNYTKIDVYLPDGSNILPITAQYLSVDANQLKTLD